MSVEDVERAGLRWSTVPLGSKMTTQDLHNLTQMVGVIGSQSPSSYVTFLRSEAAQVELSVTKQAQ